MDGVCESDYTFDYPEVAKDSEPHIAKQLLIPPVEAASQAVKRAPRRDDAQKLARKPTDDIPVTKLPMELNPIHPIVQWFLDLERFICKLVLG